MNRLDLKSEGLSLIWKDWRKVRTPKANIAGNARPSRDEDQCNRKQVRKTSVLAVVKPGKLYVVQAQIGQHIKQPAWLAGRVHEGIGNNAPRWMIILDRIRLKLALRIFYLTCLTLNTHLGFNACMKINKKNYYTLCGVLTGILALTVKNILGSLYQSNQQALNELLKPFSTNSIIIGTILITIIGASIALLIMIKIFSFFWKVLHHRYPKTFI